MYQTTRFKRKRYKRNYWNMSRIMT